MQWLRILCTVPRSKAESCLVVVLDLLVAFLTDSNFGDVEVSSLAPSRVCLVANVNVVVSVSARASDYEREDDFESKRESEYQSGSGIEIDR